MTSPNFLIIGAQKAGSSWLLHRLRQHPKIFMPRSEIHYFDKAYNYSKGIEWYESFFTDVTTETAIGEKTPDYLWANGNGVEGHLPEVHQNIYQTLPQAKLIVTVRNPVERAISAVNHIVRTGRISPFQNIDDLLLGNKRYLVEGHGVIDYGFYYRQIMAYLEYFDRSQMLLLIFEEDIVQNPEVGLNQVCEFLSVSTEFRFSDLDQKANPYHHSKLRLVLNYYLPFLAPLTRRVDRYLPAKKMRPSESVTRELYEIYAEENKQLFDFLGYEPMSWQLDSP